MLEITACLLLATELCCQLGSRPGDRNSETVVIDSSWRAVQN